MSALPGPQSKPATLPSALSTLRLEMPPILSTNTVASARPNTPSVEGRHQRGALATGCHIPAAKVGHHGNACALGQQGRVVQLQGVARAIEFLGAMAHGLPMGADGPHGAGGGGTVLQQVVHNTGIGQCQRIAREGRAVQFVGAGAVEGEQFRS